MVRGQDFARFGINDLVELLRFLLAPHLPLFEPIALAIHFEDVDVVGKAIEERAGQTLIPKTLVYSSLPRSENANLPLRPNFA